MALGMVITLDKAGRIVLPKPIRDELQLRPGDALEVGLEGARVSLTPVAQTAELKREHGIPVLHGTGPITVEDVRRTIHRVRQQRMRRILGDHD
jgi:AbrB family looped-hinge helix DNA binding protein